MFGVGATELLLILVLALVFIGPQKLPEVARMFGRTYREIQNALEDVRREFVETSDAEHEPEPAAKDAAHPDAKHPEAPVGSVEMTPPASRDLSDASSDKKADVPPDAPRPA